MTSAASSASITLNLSATGEEEWRAVVSTLNTLKDALDSVGKNASKAVPKTLTDEVKRLRAEVKAGADAFAAFRAGMEASASTQQKVANSTKTTTVAKGNLQKASKSLTDQVKREGASFDALEGDSRSLVQIQKEVTAETKREKAAIDLLFDVMGKATKGVAALKKTEEARDLRSMTAMQKAHNAAIEAQAVAQEDVISTQHRLKTLQGQLNAIMKASPTWAGSKQASPFRAMAEEMERLAKSKNAIPVEKIKQFAVAVANAATASQRWGKDIQTLSGRLTFFEQQMDAILRASYRFKAAGADLQRFARGIYNGFKQFMDVFGEFDFAIRRAAGATSLFEFTGGIESGLKAISEAAITAAREIRLIPLAEVAKGFYFWGSMTGVVVRGMTDLNELVKGHTAILKVASMTEVGFEQALKGVYGVLTQFYGGDLSKTTEVTEKLFYITQKTAAEFMDLVNSFKMVGPVAKGLNVSFDEVLTTIGQLADLGLRGTMAGRAIRQILIQLAKPSVIAKKALEGAFTDFLIGFKDLDAEVRARIGGIEGKNSYYEAVFPASGYVGIKQQMKVIAAMMLDMEAPARANLLAVMSTANSLPVLMALVGREIRLLQTGINTDIKTNLEEAKNYFDRNWELLSGSWKAVVGGMQRTWEAMKVTVGGAIAEWASPILDWISRIIEKVREWAAANPELVKSITKSLALVGVLSAIAGAVLTLTGALLGLGAVTYVFTKSFFPAKVLAEVGEAGAAAAKSVAAVGKAVGETTAKFGAMAKSGLITLIGAIGILVALLESVQRNIDYIRVRFEEAFSSASDQSNALRGALDLLVDLLGKMQEGVNLVFDQLVRRIADFVVTFAHIGEGMSEAVKRLDEFYQGVLKIFGLSGGLGDVANLLDEIAKTIGIIVGAMIISRMLKFVLLLSGIPKVLLAIKVGALTAGGALKSMWASTGVGLVVVGLSLLVDWLGTANQSIEELRANVEAAALPFGELGEAAEVAARRIARSQTAAPVDTTGLISQGGMIRRATGLWFTETAEEQMERDFIEYQQTIERKTTEILNRWRDSVSDWQDRWRDEFGTSGFLTNERFFRISVDLERLNIAESYKGQLDDIAAEISRINPGASVENLKAAYRSIATRYATSLSFDQFLEIVGTAMEREAEAARASQRGWGVQVEKVIKALGLTPESTVAAWAEAAQKTVTYNGETLKILELIGRDMIPPNTLEKIIQGVSQGTDNLVEDIENSSFAAAELKNLSTALNSMLARFIGDAYIAALPGFREIIDRINEATATGTDRDPEKLFALIFNSQIEQFEAGTFKNALISSDGISKEMRDALMGWLQQLADQGSLSAQQLLKALNVEETGNNLTDAVTTFFTSAKDAFMSAVKGGIRKTWREIESDLKKRLSHGVTDTTRISRLLSRLVGSDALRAALTQTFDLTLRHDAMVAARDNLLIPALGGIQLAIENNTDTPKMATAFKNAMKEVFSFPPEVLPFIIGENAAAIAEIYKALEIPLPPELAQFISGEMQETVNNIKPPTIPSKWFLAHEFDTPAGGGAPKGGAVSALAKNFGDIAKQAAVDAEPVIREQAAKVGNTFVDSAVQVIGMGTTAVSTVVSTVVTSMSTPAIVSSSGAGGFRVGDAWGDGLVRGLRTAIPTVRETAQLIKDLIHGDSPPKTGPLKDIDVGGYNVGKVWGDNLGKGAIRSIRQAALQARAALRSVESGGRTGGAEYTVDRKRSIAIKIDVSSKDGSVDRVAQGELRRGLMDALALSDLEHFVTVG